MLTRFAFPRLLLASLAALLGHGALQAQAIRPTLATANTRPGVTTIYLVRHAEKDATSDPTDQTLSAAGQVRALALRQLLVRRHPSALFTTDTKRTRATLAPLAEATKLEPQVYDKDKNSALVARIRQEYAGKTVVVVGHSNTLLPLIEALGGTAPVREIADDQYSYLFTVRVPAGGKAPTVAVRSYGSKHKGPATAGAARMH